MKVNITGKGSIPGVKGFAPAQGIELDKLQIMRILNFPSFKVYDAKTKKYICKANIEEFFNTQVPVEAKKDPAPIAEVVPVVEEVVEPEVSPVEEVVESVVSPVEEVVDIVEISPVEEVADVVEISPVEETEEEDNIEPVVEETTDETVVDNTTPKNNKRRKRK